MTGNHLLGVATAHWANRQVVLVLSWYCWDFVGDLSYCRRCWKLFVKNYPGSSYSSCMFLNFPELPHFGHIQLNHNPAKNLLLPRHRIFQRWLIKPWLMAVSRHPWQFVIIHDCSSNLVFFTIYHGLPSILHHHQLILNIPLLSQSGWSELQNNIIRVIDPVNKVQVEKVQVLQDVLFLRWRIQR